MPDYSLTPVDYDPFPDANDPQASARAYLRAKGIDPDTGQILDPNAATGVLNIKKTAPATTPGPVDSAGSPINTDSVASSIWDRLSQFLYGNKSGFSEGTQQISNVPAGAVENLGRNITENIEHGKATAAQGVQNLKQGNIVAGVPQALVGTAGEVLSPFTGILGTANEAVDPFMSPGIPHVPEAPTLAQHLATAHGLSPTDFIPAMLAGPSARGADLNKLNLAQQLAEQGIPKEQIYDQTGWFQSQAGDWGYQLPPGAKLKDVSAPTLGQAIDYPALFDAYPDLAGIKMGKQREAGATYHPDTKTITFRPSADLDLPRIVHEAMHGVQDVENWSFGTSPQHPAIIDEAQKVAAQSGGDPEDIAYDLYHRVVAEVIARNAATRALMSPEDLATNPYPWSTEDVLAEHQINPTGLYSQYGFNKYGAKSLNEPYFWRWKKSDLDPTSSKATFYSQNNNQYKVYVEPQKDDPNAAELSFFDENGGFNLNNSELTSAPKIFSTVLDIARNYAKEHPNLEKIIFDADVNEPSRVKLYRMLAKRLSNKFSEEQTPQMYRLDNGEPVKFVRFSIPISEVKPEVAKPDVLSLSKPYDYTWHKLFSEGTQEGKRAVFNTTSGNPYAIDIIKNNISPRISNETTNLSSNAEDKLDQIIAKLGRNISPQDLARVLTKDPGFYKEDENGPLHEIYDAMLSNKIKFDDQKEADLMFMDKNGRIDLTNSEGKDAMRVFSTVIDAVRNMVTQDPSVSRIRFSADTSEPSRVRLYSALANRLGDNVRVQENPYGYTDFSFDVTPKLFGTAKSEASSFTRPYKTDWTLNQSEPDGSNYSSAEFYTKNLNHYTIDLDNDGAGNMEVNFSAPKGVTLNNLEGSDSVRVFSTVINALKDKISQDPTLNTISFSANRDEPSRVKLYDLLAKRFGGKVEVSSEKEDPLFKHYIVHIPRNFRLSPVDHDPFPNE